MKRRIKEFLKGGVVLFVCFAALETVLRLDPDLIALPLLRDFSSELRIRIADRRHLSSGDTSQHVIAADGAEISWYRPHTTITEVTGEGVGEITTDDAGFCNPPEYPYSRPQIDLLVLGDSLAWCTAVLPEQTFTSTLGKLTGGHIYNLAVVGTGPYEELEVLKHFGIQKSPRAVIMTIYGGTDFRDAYRYQQQKHASQSVVASSATAEAAKKSPDASASCFLPDALCPLYRRLFKEGALARIGAALDEKLFRRGILGRSYAFNMLYANFKFIKNWALYIHSPASSYKPPEFPDFQYEIAGPEHARILFNRNNHDLDEPEYAAIAERGDHPFTAYDEALAEFTALGKSRHFTPIILYLPSAHIAYNPVTFHDARLAGLLAQFSDDQRTYLRQRSKASGIVFLDVTDYLRHESASHRTLPHLLYFPGNLHLAPEGHRAVARFIAQQFKNDILKQ